MWHVMSGICLFFSQAFFKLSSSPEAFLTLRSHFVRTHATLSVCHYVLGIGDRHLSNFMVDLESGGAVGIDFGHAFGTATQVRMSATKYLHTSIDQHCTVSSLSGADALPANSTNHKPPATSL